MSVPATPVNPYVKPVHHAAPIHPNLRAVAPAPPAPAAPSTVYEEPIQYEQQVYAEAPGAPVLKAYEAVPDLPLPAQEAYEAPVEAPAPIAAPKPVAYETPDVVQAPVAAAPAPGVHATQYHAQDEFGNVIYGYSNPNSAKTEQRDAYGNVVGAYSYDDGTGYPKHVSYVADDFGFRITATNNLPVAHV